jgi:hypothetical protein
MEDILDVNTITAVTKMQGLFKEDHIPHNDFERLL